MESTIGEPGVVRLSRSPGHRAFAAVPFLFSELGYHERSHPMGAMIVVDAFWGDSGKGKIGAFLGQKYRAAFCVRAGTGTNAGHSIYFEDGREIKTNQ
jgi:hypothetical protein